MTADFVLGEEAKMLNQTDSVEIISLVDNAVDFISTTPKEKVKQVREWTKEEKGTQWMKEKLQLPLAEHGFSVLIRVIQNGEKRSILFDTGYTRDGAVMNAQRMGLNLKDIEAIVLSHGHPDHFGGLLAVAEVVKKNIPIIVHPDMFKPRAVVDPDGTLRTFLELPTSKQIEPLKYVEMVEPSLLLNNSVLVTGEIPRRTDFETGLATQRLLVDNTWKPDPWVRDDRSIAVNVREKGLVVISGCAHSGIINTLQYIQQIAKTDHIYAVIGGFHLSGQDCEKRIEKTVDELVRINPDIVIPSHCTGWRGILRIAHVMPKAFIWNSVGNLYRI